MPEMNPFRDAAEKLEFRLVTSAIAAYARSVFGRERIDELAPSSVPAEIMDELSRAGEFRALLDADDPPPLDEIEDCRPALQRAAIEGSMLPSQDLKSILSALRTFRNLAAFFQKRNERTPMLAASASELLVDKMLEFHIDRVIDEEGEVKDGASKELRQIRREIIEKTGQLRRRMESILKRVSEDDMVREELVTLRDGRMVLPVKVEHKRQVQGFIHSASATGQTVYIEPTETLDLNNEIRDLQFAEQRETAKILSELTNKLRPRVAGILQSLSVYADLDSLRARAQYAAAVNASIPEILVRGPLQVVQARHPVLMQHRKQEEVVPLDLTLGDPETTLIITGPNAGGKSVAMKTVGLLSLMVQSGIPAPCAESSRFPVYAGVYVDIGDEQSVENDLSTFSSHVQRLASIVRAADERSLVLIDEIGTGTDPGEGSALGAAILETLTARRAHVIATTHHGMLKAFAHEHPAMLNAAMEFDMESLRPTYRFRAGLPGSSYAFEITRRHGMDERVIGRARELLGSRGDALEKLLAEVEKRAQELGARSREAARVEAEHKNAVAEYEHKLTELRRQTKEIRREALEDARKVMEEANSAVENAVREIRESHAEKETVRRAKEHVEDVRKRVEDGLRDVTPSKTVPPAAPLPARPLRVGDTVAPLDDLSRRGIVLDESRGGHVTVAFGMMKMRMDACSLRIMEPEAPRSGAPSAVGDTPPRNEIDLRGMYGDDAVNTLDTYLYEAYSAGFRRIDIIHGKGTGVLRKRVQEFLRGLSFVESFRLGEWNEGSSGVTVVFLKD